jgi:molybdopterin molybdotransferase
MPGLVPVEQALETILATAGQPLDMQSVPLIKAHGRTLARTLRALRSQPSFDASAMDGYAARSADLAPQSLLRVIGESRAGSGFRGAVAAGQCVRIFTGAPLPEGADTIILQENATLAGTLVSVQQDEPAGRYIRRKGLDFAEGDALLAAGSRLGANEIALAAAMNYADIAVVRQPRVAVLATGDELVRPGGSVGADQIIASNSFAVAAMVAESGGSAIDLGIVPDDVEQLSAAIRTAEQHHADILVTLGGASVGDYDLTQQALAAVGMELAFWKIAMRPGKPLMHGRIGAMRVLGLPGNPVSAIVCALLFLRPLILALLGDSMAARDPSEPAFLGSNLAANDGRQDYLRASLRLDAEGRPVATAFGLQDSSVLTVLARSQCLIVRQPFAPAAASGSPCRILRIRQ